MKLRDYQTDIISETRLALRDVGSVLIQSSTGSGKTALSAFMSGSAAKRQKRVIFGVHRKELVLQTAKTFQQVGIPFGLIAPGFTGDRHQLVQIASVQTLAKRRDRYGVPDLYIPDEAQHASAATWAETIEAYAEEGAKIVGLSATPERLDGKGLGRWFQRMVKGPPTAWLIDQGYLSPYKLYAPGAPALDGVKKTAGDFNRKDLEDVIGKTAVTGDAVEHYRRLCHGMRAMVFCVSIKHSLGVVEKFQAAGYRAAHIDGTSPNRAELIEDFTAGQIQVLSSVDLVSEGFDLPAMEVAILLRPTFSLSLYLQQVGRVLRPVYAKGFDLSTRLGRIAAIAAGPKPWAYILDHGGNSIPIERGGRGHGAPDDEREWSLEGREKKKRQTKSDEEEKIPVRQCPKCYRVHPPAPKCPKCGHEYQVLGRTVEELAGELVEVDKATLRVMQKKEERKAQTVEDLIEIGKARNYANPAGWAKKYFAARNGSRSQRYERA